MTTSSQSVSRVDSQHTREHTSSSATSTDSLMEAVHAGVQLFISAHGFSYEDVVRRPSLKAVLELGIFDRFVELSKARGPGTVMQVKDKYGKPVLSNRKAEGVW